MTERIFCAHADHDGAGAHWMREGDACPLDCGHDSLDGIDDAPLDDPQKVWECNACHARFRIVPTGRGTTSMLVSFRGGVYTA